MATSFLSFSLTFLLLCYVSVAQIGFGRDYGLSPWRGSPRLGAQNRCSFERLSAHNASRRVESEAGVTEYFDETNEQFQCAGIAAFRRTIQPGGILLPAYSNFHQLAYIEQGRGLAGVVIPGCPATFQQQHQKIRRFETGDILVLPAGLAHFCYNDGEAPVVVVVVEDTSNFANQLDRKRRHFQLAGTQPREEGQQQEDSSDGNMISGFDAELLAESFGISVELVRKLQKTEEKKGEIVKAEGELKMVALPIEEETEEGRRVMNGLEQAFCAVKLTENIDRPSLADIYNPRGGRITNVNVLKLPILSFIQMSASRGVLFKQNCVKECSLFGDTQQHRQCCDSLGLKLRVAIFFGLKCRTKFEHLTHAGLGGRHELGRGRSASRELGLPVGIEIPRDIGLDFFYK